jgi:hypothetical protein
MFDSCPRLCLVIWRLFFIVRNVWERAFGPHDHFNHNEFCASYPHSPNMDVEKAPSAQTTLTPVSIAIGGDEQARTNTESGTTIVGPTTAPSIATWKLVSLYSR